MLALKEYRIENHIFRWSVIETERVNGVTYALMESSIGDEAPYILVQFDESKFYEKEFKGARTGKVTKLPMIPEALVVSDDVYDDIITALEDNDIL